MLKIRQGIRQIVANLQLPPSFRSRIQVRSPFRQDRDPEVYRNKNGNVYLCAKTTGETIPVLVGNNGETKAFITFNY
jgi:hypothetical protein